MNKLLLIIFTIIFIFFQLALGSSEHFNPTKCFSCESELSYQKKYLANPSKCFSCEKQYINNGLNPIYSQPTKCFSCN